MKSFILKLLFTTSFLSLFSATNISYLRNCEFNNKKNICKFSAIINSPANTILRGWADAKGAINHILESKKLTLYGSHSKTREPLETRNRFKTLEAGFNFNYKPMTRENAGYILISKFDAENDGTPAIEIWDLKEQVLIHRYQIDWQSIKVGLNNNNLSDLFLNPMLMEDGSLLLNSVGGWGGAIVKIDKCGKYLAHNSDYLFHHSIEIDKKGNIYSPIENATTDQYFEGKNAYSFSDHGFAILDNNLNVKKTFSLLEIYKKNGLISDVYGGDSYSNNPFHLNVVLPFTRSDGSTIVLMSLLSQSTVLAYDVEADNIIWKIDHATMHQHDVDIINSYNGFIDISIFDNNTQKYFDRIETLGNEIVIFRSIPINKNKRTLFIQDQTDFVNYKMERIKFENLKKEFVPKTISGGRSDFLNKNNSIMIEETDYGRIFEIDYSTKEILWQYVNKTDKGKAPFQLSWTRRLNKLPTNFKEIEFKNCIQNYDL